MAAVASGKPSGKYADRMLVGAWPESDPADLYAQQQRWREMRDAARDQFHEMKDNATQLRQVLDGDGFDGLHRDRELVARNFDFLGETRDDASRIWEHAGDAAGVLRKSMASTVRIVEQEITDIEMNPLLEDSEKQALIDALVEATNAQLIGQSAEAGAALASQVASHAAYMGSLPWHTSTANAAPHTPSPSPSGIQALNTGWKQAPALPGETGNGNGNGQAPGSTERPPTQGTEKPGTSEKPGTTERPKDVPPTPAQQRPAPGSTERPAAQSPTAPQTPSAPGAVERPSVSPPMSLPPLSTPGGSGAGLGGPPGGGGLSGLGGGGLSPGGLASPPQGLLSANQLGAVPSAAANPLSSASAPAASGLGAGAPKASVPMVQAPPAQAVPAVATPPAAAPAGGSVQPAGMSSALPPPVAQSGAAPPASGTLGPAPALAGPPPPPAGAMAPVGPSAPAVPPPGVGAPPGPFHSPLPPVGTPIVRGGLVERAEDPDIIRARQLIWELTWAGRRYPSLDWAIGLHRASGDTGPTRFFITSSEGEGYIPQHVHLPVDPVLIPIFQDAEFARPGWRQQWQGWVDPARIVHEHHRLRQEAVGRSVLHAIVSSREISGLSHMLPAGVVLEVVDPEKNPFVDPLKATEIPAIATGRAHRLAIASPDLFALVQKVPESERWSAGVDLAADAAAATDERHVRQGLVVRDMPGLQSMDSGAAVLHSVIDQLRVPGGAVDAGGWAQLQTAYWTQVMGAQGRRHTPQDLTDDTGYIDAYRRARAYEGAWLLNAPAGPLSADWLADVAYTHLCATDNPNRCGDLLVARV